MKKLVAAFLSYVLLVNTSFALESEKSSSIAKVIKKYDFMLSAHPSAHLESFKEKALNNFKKEIEALTENFSKEELVKIFEELVVNTPSKEKRESYLKLLRSSTRAEIEAFAFDQELLEETFRGEGSNFTGDVGETLLYAALIGAAVYAIIFINSRYEFFTSRRITDHLFGEHDVCSRFDFSQFERNTLREEARQLCLSNARFPQTCEFSSFPTSTLGNSCRMRARYRARKELDTVSN